MSFVEAVSHWHVPAFTVNDRLGKARTDADITQERMAEMLGCSRRTIVRYERSGENVPRSVLLAYHVATQTDLGWLETGKASTQSVEAGVHPLGLEPRTHCYSDATVTHIDDAPSIRTRLATAADRARLLDGDAA